MTRMRLLATAAFLSAAALTVPSIADARALGSDGNSLLVPVTDQRSDRSAQSGSSASGPGKSEDATSRTGVPPADGRDKKAEGDHGSKHSGMSGSGSSMSGSGGASGSGSSGSSTTQSTSNQGSFSQGGGSGSSTQGSQTQSGQNQSTSGSGASVSPQTNTTVNPNTSVGNSLNNTLGGALGGSNTNKQ